MKHNCETDDRKLPIDRPCSACGDGDTAMEYHDHCPPFREQEAGNAPFGINEDTGWPNTQPECGHAIDCPIYHAIATAEAIRNLKVEDCL